MQLKLGEGRSLSEKLTPYEGTQLVRKKYPTNGNAPQPTNQNHLSGCGIAMVRSGEKYSPTLNDHNRHDKAGNQ